MEQQPARYQTMIRDLPLAERPRERLRAYGAGALSTGELLAILLRVGSLQESVLQQASRLLTRFGGLAGLARAPFAQLAHERGVGAAKAAQVKAALELGRRLLATLPEDRPVITSPGDVANLVMGEMAFLDQERLRTVLVNTRNEVMAVQEVYRGSVNRSLVRVAELFRGAVVENCPALIMVHNHPSGDPTPSPEDIHVTRQAVEGGRLLDIEVLDHVIIGAGRFVSMRERGLGFGESVSPVS